MTNVKTAPFPHQVPVIADTLRNLRAQGFHGEFVDMGLGKTLITLACYETLIEEQAVDHLIIVAPKSILATWRDEISKHLVRRDVLQWKSLGVKTMERALTAFSSEPCKVFLVNVEAFQSKNMQLHNFLARLLTQRRCLMVNDESSYIKSPTAARTKALLKLAADARYRMILTGTEITKSCLDLYTQMKFLRHDFWAPLEGYYAFRYKYAILETDYGPGGRSFQVVCGFQRQDELMAKIAPHVSRLKKDDVLDLPPKRYQDVWLEMPAAMRRVYDQLKRELITQYAGQELTVANQAVLFGRFRQIVGGYFPGVADVPGIAMDAGDNAKLQFLLDDIEDTDEKILVWACFTEEIKLLNRHVPGAIPLYGEMSQSARDAAVAAFRDPAGPRVMIANPAVAGFGLNLQFCRLVYWYSNPVQSAQRWQGEDRNHRIGTKKSVLYKDLLYKNSVDIRVKQLLADKMETRELFRGAKSVKEFLEVF